MRKRFSFGGSCLVTFFLLLASVTLGTNARSQESTSNVLEIPVIVDPGQPKPDASFVGDWCGWLRLSSVGNTATTERYSCLRINRAPDGGVLLGAGASVPQESLAHKNLRFVVQLVSESAHARGPREILATTVVNVESRPLVARATITTTDSLRLTSEQTLLFSDTREMVVMTPDYVPVQTSRMSGTTILHPVAHEEYDSWATSRSGVGGGHLSVPEAK